MVIRSFSKPWGFVRILKPYVSPAGTLNIKRSSGVAHAMDNAKTLPSVVTDAPTSSTIVHEQGVEREDIGSDRLVD